MLLPKKNNIRGFNPVFGGDSDDNYNASEIYNKTSEQSDSQEKSVWYNKDGEPVSNNTNGSSTERYEPRAWKKRLNNRDEKTQRRIIREEQKLLRKEERRENKELRRKEKAEENEKLKSMSKEERKQYKEEQKEKRKELREQKKLQKEEQKKLQQENTEKKIEGNKDVKEPSVEAKGNLPNSDKSEAIDQASTRSK